ncbi:MAG: antitoxin family protein [Methanomicrobiales archaeon]|nr:antitoxin family protein [Methanomicrobiales archaeon]MDI6877297.1 antitoxin family protein [Methanomicrobiales archaeon]
MARRIEVVFEGGVFKPLDEVTDLEEGTRAYVHIPTEEGEFICEYKTWQDELQEEGWDVYD